ncbi:MAG: hypothetical protein DMF11_06895 [Verrucomicrobia bacterium]|nr:MAG: hypothetical protein DMF11_06895 [Verrucomicrobiota bacterium]
MPDTEFRKGALTLPSLLSPDFCWLVLFLGRYSHRFTHRVVEFKRARKLNRFGGWHPYLSVCQSRPSMEFWATFLPLEPL